MGINPWQVDMKVFQLKELVSIVSKSHPSLFSVIVKLQTFQSFISSSPLRWRSSWKPSAGRHSLVSRLLSSPHPRPRQPAQLQTVESCYETLCVESRTRREYGNN